jgi:CBS domain containing-hemolysin-like protein
VFSIDSILTAVGMTDHLPIMIIAVIVAVTVMLLAADPLGNFINNNPTVVMLALGFLLMIGTVLIAEGFGMHVPKGYIYAAMAFSAGVEGLNMMSRKAAAKKTRHATAATKRSRRGSHVRLHESDTPFMTDLHRHRTPPDARRADDRLPAQRAGPDHRLHGHASDHQPSCMA